MRYLRPTSVDENNIMLQCIQASDDNNGLFRDKILILAFNNPHCIQSYLINSITKVLFKKNTYFFLLTSFFAKRGYVADGHQQCRNEPTVSEAKKVEIVVDNPISSSLLLPTTQTPKIRIDKDFHNTTEESTSLSESTENLTTDKKICPDFNADLLYREAKVKRKEKMIQKHRTMIAKELKDLQHK
ncbi:hypothetical protein RFI_07326 [Reticulomyxa filosa]|uniref:Uncharacterized protein n=1 Tax=Reticulomyxa filosa TaxID=46433 RepID=X6NV73_RETFI|nr:hypothetical protein RFI_07326 [Reticulomyxa filosa]|eukprot:ETO29793.1 hypothetical protein RFI_07326 [Reticulomyxa filosa]